MIPLDEICRRMSHRLRRHLLHRTFQPAYWELDPLEVARNCRESVKGAFAAFQHRIERMTRIGRICVIKS